MAESSISLRYVVSKSSRIKLFFNIYFLFLYHEYKEREVVDQQRTNACKSTGFFSKTSALINREMREKCLLLFTTNKTLERQFFNINFIILKTKKLLLTKSVKKPGQHPFILNYLPIIC